jgi:hypothetical protein
MKKTRMIEFHAIKDTELCIKISAQFNKWAEENPNYKVLSVISHITSYGKKVRESLFVLYEY